MTKLFTKKQGRLVYVTVREILKANDWAYCTETREIIQIAEVKSPEHLYEDTNGKIHYDNFDPWDWRKIVRTNDPDVYEKSDYIEWMDNDEYIKCILSMGELPLHIVDCHRKHFTPIYDGDGKEANPIPEHTRVTIYCEGNESNGYLLNITAHEGGLELLIAKSWILETELRKLVAEYLKETV